MIKKLSDKIKSKKGMTLVEVLTAMTIIMLMVFCFTPLFINYLDTVVVSGKTVKDVQKEAGILQTLIGSKGTTANTGFVTSISKVPLQMTTPDATVKRGSEQCTVNGVTLGVGDKAGLGDFIDPITGNFLSSNPDDLRKGFTTIYTDSINSNIKCFPSTLTDDFKVAYLTLVADGFNFVEDSFGNTNFYKLSCTIDDGTNKTGNKTLKFGKDYSIERVKGTENMLLLTLYGGTDISFENSPLVFEYMGGAYTKEIEVDAPQMMMVGEPASDGKYYYYVSRGEIDENGNLVILRREMDSVDPKTGEKVTLNSTMNDVEWVPADSADQYAKDGQGKPYGYYVMCGNNGQIRRFWRNNTTGNYYWGGDYTYDTDVFYDKVEKDAGASVNDVYYMHANKKYGTDVSYKFVVRRDHTKEGFKMGAFKYGLAYFPIMSANVWTSTAFAGAGAKSTYYYASDGKIHGFYTTDAYAPPNGKAPPEYSDVVASLTRPNGDLPSNPMGSNAWGTQWGTEGGRTMQGKETGGVNQESLTWMKADIDNENAFYQLTGEDKAKYNPITLTCVDAIVLNNTGGAAYETNIAHGSYELSEHGGVVTPGFNYPKETYTLYCGYIPGAMDAWTQSTGFIKDTDVTYNQKFRRLFTADSNHKTMERYDISGASHLNRSLGNETLFSGVDYPKWKGNYGITPVITGTLIEPYLQGTKAYWGDITGWKRHNEYIYYYPYSNLNYAVTGKLYDTSTNIDGLFANGNLTSVYDMPYRTYNTMYGKQQHITNGKVVDITLSYLSNPLATHLAFNPTDDMAFDVSSNKDGNDVLYWNNRRETVTYLDCASTFIPNGESDVPVSLMVGYTMGGLVEYSGDDAFINTVMNNGIVALRAGEAYIEKQGEGIFNPDSKTYEYYARDKSGYKLNQESNFFHQFYYLNSRTGLSDETLIRNSGIGNVFGADYWENNRHIDYVSMYGGQPDDPNNKNSGSYDYLRCHPMSNTQVYCVDWGWSWNGNPEAMWGTENGTLLSWYVDLNDARQSDSFENDVKKYGDRSVDAEFQSYKWIDNVNGKTFKVTSKNYANYVGANGATFSISDWNYKEFFDKATRQIDNELYGKTPTVMLKLGFISVLDCVADIGYDNDCWVAVGDWSGKDPADYCASEGMAIDTSKDSDVTTLQKAYTGNGRGGSWVNVRYWVDLKGTNTANEGNNYHLWKAVQVSKEEGYNFIQVSFINGIWMATGYHDANDNDEWDEGEKSVVCWATDPTAPCGTPGGWSDKTVFWDNDGNGKFSEVSNSVGGINSVATRS